MYLFAIYNTQLVIIFVWVKITLFLENTMVHIGRITRCQRNVYNLFIIYKIIKRSCEIKGIPGKHSLNGWRPIIVSNNFDYLFSPLRLLPVAVYSRA